MSRPTPTDLLSDDLASLNTRDPEFEAFLRKAARVGRESWAPALPNVGDVVGGRYRIEERIGRGGMGAVFRATHMVTQKQVALKWMLRSASDEHARARFLREARVAARVDHPNVVDLYDLDEQDGCCYLVLELLHGESLRERLERGPISVEEARDLLVPAMQGVSALHRAGVLHRDLKPDNIYLCRAPDGTPREAKVLDFGIAMMIASETTDRTLTADGIVLGTPQYMSPEQLESPRDLDVSSDVYSFGVILYEALTGKLPFTADSYSSLVLAVVHQTPKPPRELVPELPVALERAVLRALAKRRGDRYPTIDSLIEAFTACVDGPAMKPRITLARVGVVAAAAALLLAAGLTHSFATSGGRESTRKTVPVAAVVRTPQASVSTAPPPPREFGPPSAMGEAAPALEDQKVESSPPVVAPRPKRVKRVKVSPCERPYSIDANGRTVFKLECI